MSEQNLSRAEAMLAHLKARGITVSVSGGQFRLQSAVGDVHENDVAALRAMLQALGLSTESGGGSAAASAPVSPHQPVPALVDADSPDRGAQLSLPLVARDVEVLRHKAGAWFSSPLGVGATLFAILLSRYQQKEDWLRELGIAIGQQAGPGEAPRAWFSLATLIKRLPADGSLREVVTSVAENLLEARVDAADSLDLALALPDMHDEDQLVWHFAGDLFDEAFVRQLHADFVAIMRQATALITPMLSAITLYGAGAGAGVGVVAGAPRPQPVEELPARENSALWRSVQAVIDEHASNNAAPALVQANPQRSWWPLSPQQWVFVLDEQKQGVGCRHNVTSAWLMSTADAPAESPRLQGQRFLGVVDLDKAQKALALLVKRHTLLRTTFEWQQTTAAIQQQDIGSPVGASQCVHLSPSIPWRALVVSTTDDLRVAARQWLHDASAQALGLFNGLPWLASVATVSNGVDSATLWRLTLHNAIADAHFADRLMAEWVALYSGEMSVSEASAGEILPLPEEAYTAYCQRQQAALGPIFQLDRHSDGGSFWTEQLQAVHPVRWPLQAGGMDAGQGSTLPFSIDAELMQRVRVASASWQVTSESILLTAFAALIRRYIEHDHFVVGVEFANRQTDSMQQVCGVTSNVLPWVAHLDAGRQSVRHRVEHTHNQLADMALYQSTPLLSVLPLLAGNRSCATQPPITIAFSCQKEVSASARQLMTRGLASMPVSRRQPRVALGLNLRCSELQASEGELEYYSEWLSAEGAAEFIAEYFHLLGTLVNEAALPLQQLPLMSLTRQQEMFDLFNRDAQSLPSFLPHFIMWWQRQCYSAPQNLAIAAAEGRMNFAELDALANQVARYLASVGVGAGDRVGLLLPRDPLLLATVLAVFKVGAAWVPVHAQWPPAYQEAVLQQAGVSCVLHDSERTPWQGSLKAIDFSITASPWYALDSDPVEEVDDPAAMACILYPVEVLPEPQGVVISHRNLSALVAWGVRLNENRPPLRAAFTRDLCAESALFEVFVTLCSGGAVVMMDDLLAAQASERPTSSAAKLLAVVNHLTITPTLAGEMLQHHLLPKGVRTLTLVGEPVPQPLLAALLAQPGISDVLVLHLCAENSGIAFAASFGEHARPALRRGASPIDGTQCVILDAHGQLQPWGIAGELFIGGAALSSGYWHAAGSGANRFVKNPLTYFPTLGNTLFNTGYRACWHVDGRIELLSTVAEYVSGGAPGFDRLRAEQYMQKVLGLTPSAMGVIAGADISTKKEQPPVITAFVKGELPARHYLQLLQRHLPATLQPQALTVVNTWPRTKADLLDRSALALQSLASQSLASQSLASHSIDGRVAGAETTPNTLELQLLRIWQELLGDRVTDIDTDFMVAGGHSLLALQLAALLAQRYALTSVPAFTTLMQYPTPRRLARWLDAALRGEESRATLWEPLGEHPASRSVLFFQTGETAAPWAQVAQSLPEGLAGYQVCYQARANDEQATLVQRYVDAIEQESLPLPAALAGEGAGGALAIAVAREMQARGWPWLPVILLDSSKPATLLPVHSRVLHVNSPQLGLAGRAGWRKVLQGETRWCMDTAPFTGEAAAARITRWVEDFLTAQTA